MADMSTRVSLLATRIANYLRDSVLPRLLPSGGLTGQSLVKSSSSDYSVIWSTNKLSSILYSWEAQV